MAATPVRTVRVSDAIWEAAQATAYLERETVTTIVLFALRAYAKDPNAYKAALGAITHRELMSAADMDEALETIRAGA